MNPTLESLIFLIARYLHIIAATALLGGTLFYEIVVPGAIDEMKDEQKPWIFARTRLGFRWIVWGSVTLLLISGVVATYRSWYAYTGIEAQFVNDELMQPEKLKLMGAGFWWLAHAITGTLGLILAVALIRGRKMPRYPLVWMRLNLLVLLIAIFLASATRHFRLELIEHQLQPSSAPTDAD